MREEAKRCNYPKRLFSDRFTGAAVAGSSRGSPVSHYPARRGNPS
jgi:hypothetical protein